MRARRHTTSRPRLALPAAVAVAAATACAASPPKGAPVFPGAPSSPAAAVDPAVPAASGVSFEDEVAFLSAAGGPPTVLASPAGGRIAVSARMQGRVMTSAVEAGGRSLGFVNRAFVAAGKTRTTFDNYGGEDRFWLGPEAGQFGLYFPPGKPFTFTNWQTPHQLQEGSWEVRAADAGSVTFARSLSVGNYAGARFDVAVERKVSLLSAAEVAARLGLPVPAGVKWVAFATSNAIRNAGTTPWVPERGLVSVWILGMFAPLPGTKVIVPFERNAAGPIVNDNYFGKVPSDRLVVEQSAGFLKFTCDGHLRSKIGLAAARAKGVLGSYSEQAQMLTLVSYSRPTGSARSVRYVNSMWEQQADPYAGDAINSYNDGPTEPGQPSLGGFYEIESSSPAAALAPGETLTHVHQTFHLLGSRQSLDPIARHVLGVSLDQAR